MTSAQPQIEPMSTSAVVVTYNSAGFVEEIVGSLRAALDAGLLISAVIADAKSTDDTVELLRRHTACNGDPRLQVLELQSNCGYAKAVNHGLRRCQDADLYLLANPDVYGLPAALRDLVSTVSEEPDAGIWAPVAFGPNGRPQAESARPIPSGSALLLSSLGFGRFLRAALVARLKVRRRPFRVSACTGAFMLVRADLLGPGMDERLFMYLEDVELCARARALGLAVICDPRVRIDHASGASRATLRAAANELDVLMGEIPWILAADRSSRWGTGAATFGAFVAGLVRIPRRRSRRVGFALLAWARSPDKPTFVGWTPAFARATDERCE